jgi:cytochrome c peroxidase
MRFAVAICLFSSLALGCAAYGEEETDTGEELLALESSEEEAAAAALLPNNFPFPNSAGLLATFSTTGSVNLDNEFFQNFGTNERNCGTCHLPTDGWGISAIRVRQLFDLTGGTHPIFRRVDGSNSPLADVSTVAKRRTAYSMLRNRGVIRIGIGVPAGAEFELIAVDDPYGFAHAGQLSLFRRPIPSVNLKFIPTVMWDGREASGATIPDRLLVQANSATVGHAQAAAPLPQAARQSIVNFEMPLFAAQLSDNVAGLLSAAGANGGAQRLSTMAVANARFNLFDAWIGIDNPPVPGEPPADAARRARRASIARGQELFNNPNAGAGGGACRGCHSAANAGSSAAAIFFNIGTSAGSRRTPDLPLYTLRNKATGQVLTTTDPGRALITGLWADVDRFKAPVLRGLASRAPFFHAGSAATLPAVVTFYEQSLGFAFTPAEEADLAAFLSAL